MIPTRPPISDRTSSVEEEAPPLPQLVPSGFYGYLKPSTCGLRVWLREQGDVEEAPPSAFGEVLMRLGIEHERRHLERFPNHIDLGELPLGRAAPRRRSRRSAAGERVIYQGALRAETTLAGRRVEIVGVPDFMLPARSGYAIRDSKLNRTIGTRYTEHVELQLETYGWLYEQTFGEPPVALQVHTGERPDPRPPLRGRRRRARDLRARSWSARTSEQEPEEYVGVSKCSACGFHSHCWPLAERAPGRRPAPLGRPEPRRRAPPAGRRDPRRAARAVRRREPRRLRATLGRGDASRSAIAPSGS